MKHFSLDEWQVFKEGMFPEDMLSDMEDHLVICGQCRNLYLSLFGEDEISKGAGHLSPDFSKQVIKAIKYQEKDRAVRKKKNRSQRGRNTPVCFAAAAAITFILMGSGFFQTLAESLPQFTAGAEIVEHQSMEEAKINWPDKLVEQASNWINNFETQDRGGL